MINYIKDAVTAVSGIKTFLFNTDYRNNFDLQHVEFPCCVLTPIMRTNYDLKNIIRESAELQLSVVDLAPYEYTGDELYAINKRCSDLALQVIANLQVKSKLDKELTFEFILPSGDELISGVMCNLQCTMKQGSCIGKPSYVEVIVQPIKRENITRNGKHVISPSKGFTAMREVEVDVFVPVPTTEEKSVEITHNGEVEILPTSADAMTKVTANVQVPPPPLEEKQVTITENGTTEIVPTSEYGLRRVEVVADVAPNLQDKQVTITENGTTTITADEGFEGLNSVEVSSNVHDGNLDFGEIYDDNSANMINQHFKDGIEYAKEIAKTNLTTPKSFENDLNLVFMPDINWVGDGGGNYAFAGCYNLMRFGENAKITLQQGSSFRYAFNNCFSLKNTPLIDMNFCFFADRPFLYAYGLEHVKLKNVSEGLSFGNSLGLKKLEIENWKSGNCEAYNSSLLSPSSIHNTIQNAMSVAEGATTRTLTLHATAKANWEASEYYEQDLAVLTDKGITIA